MSNVSVSLSQNVVNTNSALAAKYGSSTLADGLDLFFKASYNFSAGHPYYSSASANGSIARFNFSDGGYQQYFGVVVADLAATTGTATATSLDVLFPGFYRLSAAGDFHYNYVTTNAQLTSFASTGSTITAAAIQTVLPTYSASYIPSLGNATTSFNGVLAVSSNQNFTGTITSFSAKDDNFTNSSALTGSINVAGNSLLIGQNLATTSVSGTVESLTKNYKDGSAISMTSLSMPVTGSSTIDVQQILSNATNFSGNDQININLPAVLATPWVISAGSGDDLITVKGGGGKLSVQAGSGNDVFTDMNTDGTALTVDGGLGIDAGTYAGVSSAYKITAASNGTFIVKGSGISETLVNVERLNFSDASFALDISGNGGQAYRIYQAALNRTPDTGGLGYWINVLDNGATLNQIAKGFMTSSEFVGKYGVNPSNTDLVSKFYLNILNRPAEADGLKYWVGVLDTRAAAPAEVLAFISESPENQVALIGVIGLAYTPYHG